jgi:hypothetical protein
VVPANPNHIDRFGVVAYYSIALWALVHGANRLTFRLVSERPLTLREAVETDAHGSTLVGMAPYRPAGLAVRGLHYESFYSPRLAPQGLSPFLEVEDSTWQAGRPAVPKEIRELIRLMSRENPLLRRSPDLRRTAQAQHRDWRNQRQQIHGPPQETAIPDLKDVPRESRKEYGVGGLLRRRRSGSRSCTCFRCWRMSAGGSYISR